MNESGTTTANFSTLSVDLDKNMNNSVPLSSYSVLSNITGMSNITVIRSSNGTQVVEDDKLFLNTPTAQALSGIFVWSALLITCHQVGSFRGTNYHSLMCLRTTNS